MNYAIIQGETVENLAYTDENSGDYIAAMEDAGYILAPLEKMLDDVLWTRRAAVGYRYDEDTDTLYDTDGMVQEWTAPEPEPEPPPEPQPLAYALSAMAQATHAAPEMVNSGVMALALDLGYVQEPVTDWAVGVLVSVGDVLQYQGMHYICYQQHITQGDWSPERTVGRLWTVQGAGDKEGDWIAWEDVKTGWVRLYDGLRYRCLQGHVTQPHYLPPEVAALWEKIPT